MSEAKDNAAQEVMDDLLTDPDKDAGDPVPPKPPQTIADEPSGDEAHGRHAPTGRSEDGGR